MPSASLKTRLFSQFDPNRRGNEDFGVDLRELLGFWADERKRSAFRAQFLKIVLAKTNKQEAAMSRALSSELSAPESATKAAIDCAKFLARELARP